MYKFWASALINPFHGKPLNWLFTEARCREHFETVLKRYGEGQYNKGVAEGRRQMRLKNKTRLWVPICK